MFNQNREDFRIMAYGQYAFSRRGDTMTKKDMDLFVEGSLFAFDYVIKMKQQQFSTLSGQLYIENERSPLNDLPQY